ncbi:MAG: hypothetical protein HY905_03885 [Deltaproteobacteria bacterium]|nr:hypothetical protein [Deltaproteobacteria bacterium]
MSASEFGREFEDDRYAADVEFRGKVLEVTGAVAEIGKDLVGQYRVVLEGGVACYFADGEMEHVNVLHLGQAVTVRGYFRAQQGRPVLDGCQFSVE